MPSMFTTSHSEVDTYNSCRRKHFYSYGLSLQQEGKQMGKALRRGITGHKFLENFFNRIKNGTSYEDSMAALELEMANECIGDNADVVSEIILPMKTFFIDYREQIESWEILEVEAARTFELDEFGSRLIFIPDMVILENGFVRVIDWKFIYDFYGAREIAIVSQLPKYIGGLKEDYTIGSGYYIMFRTRQLKSPESKDLVQIMPIQPTQSRIEAVLRDQQQIAKEIAYLKGLTTQEWDYSSPRNIDVKKCGYCSFQAICSMDMNGVDSTAEKERNFVTRPPSEFRKYDGVAAE